MRKFYLSLCLLVLIFQGKSLAQEIIISYDFSGSMQMYELTSQDFNNWNQVLKEVLFYGAPDLPVNTKIIHLDGTLSMPLIKDDSIVSFYRMGDQVTPFFEKQIVDEAYFSTFIPKNIKQLRDQNTLISQAELNFLRAAAIDINTIWINISDEDQDVDLQKTPNLSEIESVLTPLRNDLHIIKMLDVSFGSSAVKDPVHLSIRKCKANSQAKYEQLLDIETPQSGILFREKVGKKRSEKTLNMTKGELKVKLKEEKKIGTGAITNVFFRVSLNDSKDRELAAVSEVPKGSLPFTIDDLVFTSEEAVAAAVNNTSTHLFIRSRYYFERKLYHQDFIVPITYGGSSSLGWLLWLLLSALLAGLVFMANKMLASGKDTDKFTLISSGPRGKHQTLSLKINESVMFGQQASVGKLKGKVYDINAPDYSLVRKEQKAFNLLRKSQVESPVALDTAFKVKDKDGKDVELTLHLGSIQNHGGEPPRRQRGQAKSSSDSRTRTTLNVRSRSSLKDRRK